MGNLQQIPLVVQEQIIERVRRISHPQSAEFAVKKTWANIGAGILLEHLNEVMRDNKRFEKYIQKLEKQLVELKSSRNESKKATKKAQRVPKAK